MIEKLKIQNFKSIQVQEFIIKPLTILTGKNSSGKSSVIQSLLLYCHHTNHNFLLNEYLGYLGVKLDEAASEKAVGEEMIISTADSKIKVYVIPTNEELMIAKETKRLAK